MIPNWYKKELPKLKGIENSESICLDLNMSEHAEKCSKENPIVCSSYT